MALGTVFVLQWNRFDPLRRFAVFYPIGIHEDEGKALAKIQEPRTFSSPVN